MGSGTQYLSRFSATLQFGRENRENDRLKLIDAPFCAHLKAENWFVRNQFGNTDTPSKKQWEVPGLRKDAQQIAANPFEEKRGIHNKNRRGCRWVEPEGTSGGRVGVYLPHQSEELYAVASRGILPVNRGRKCLEPYLRK